MTCRCAPNARCGRCDRLVLSTPPRFGKMHAYREWLTSNGVYSEDGPNHFVGALSYVLLHANEPQWRPYDQSSDPVHCPRCGRRPSKSMGCPDECKEQS